MKGKKVSKAQKLKGDACIFFGALGILIYVLVQFAGGNMGRSGFFMLLVSFFLIYEGSKIKKGEKSSLFDAPSWGNYN